MPSRISFKPLKIRTKNLLLNTKRKIMYILLCLILDSKIKHSHSNATASWDTVVRIKQCNRNMKIDLFEVGKIGNFLVFKIV